MSLRGTTSGAFGPLRCSLLSYIFCRVHGRARVRARPWTGGVRARAVSVTKWEFRANAEQRRRRRRRLRRSLHIKKGLVAKPPQSLPQFPWTRANPPEPIPQERKKEAEGRKPHRIPSPRRPAPSPQEGGGRRGDKRRRGGPYRPQARRSPKTSPAPPPFVLSPSPEPPQAMKNSEALDPSPSPFRRGKYSEFRCCLPRLPPGAGGVSIPF